MELAAIICAMAISFFCGIAFAAVCERCKGSQDKPKPAPRRHHRNTIAVMDMKTNLVYDRFCECDKCIADREKVQDGKTN